MTYPYDQPGQDPQQGGYPQQPQGGYPQSGGFQQPGTPPGGYAQTPYPGTPVYPAGPGYQPQNQLVNTRPGGVTASAVLGFVQAGITICTTIMLLFVVAGAPSAADSAELTLAWLVTIAQAVGAGLLIYGSVQLMSGASRLIYLVASGIEIAICLYYLIRIASVDVSHTLPGAMEGKSAATIVPILFAVMPVIGLSLALTGAAAAWTRSRSA